MCWDKSLICLHTKIWRQVLRWCCYEVFICCDIYCGGCDFTILVNYISPTVSLVLWISYFCGLMSHTILPYFTFRSCGICGFGMNKIAFDPENLLTTPCTSLTNFLEKYLRQTILSSPLTRYLYSCLNPVSGWMTAFICSFLGWKIASGVTVEIWLAASMNMLQVGYRCGGGEISADLPVKLTLVSFSLVWYCVYSGTWSCGAIASTLRVGGSWL